MYEECVFYFILCLYTKLMANIKIRNFMKVNKL